MTECCTVVMSTAFAMDVPPVSVNDFSYLQTKWRTPKAGVTGSNPVGRATFHGSIPDTWLTDYIGDISNTFGLNGFSMGSSLQVS